MLNRLNRHRIFVSRPLCTLLLEAAGGMCPSEETHFAFLGQRRVQQVKSSGGCIGTTKQRKSLPPEKGAAQKKSKLRSLKDQFFVTNFRVSLDPPSQPVNPIKNPPPLWTPWQPPPAAASAFEVVVPHEDICRVSTVDIKLISGMRPVNSQATVAVSQQRAEGSNSCTWEQLLSVVQLYDFSCVPRV